jgi:hypothetical protein
MEETVSEPFDPTLYARAPSLDVPSAVALGVSLISALPKEAPPEVIGSARKMRTSIVALQSAWARQPDRAVDRRPADQASDAAWAAFDARLDGYASLPAERHPEAARATEIRATLLPDGLGFLKLPYPSQWAEQERRLQVIDARGMAPEIDEICGPAFLQEIRATHAAYGEALGITSPSPRPPSQSLTEPLREAQRAIARYLRKVSSMGEDGDEAAAMARRALAPVDAFRAAAQRRAAPVSEDDETPPVVDPPEATPDTPIPPIS